VILDGLAGLRCVAIVVADHFVEKCPLLDICYLFLSIALLNPGYHVVNQHIYNVLAVSVKTLFNHTFVTSNAVRIMLLILLLYRCNSAPSSPARGHKIFERSRKHGPFLGSEVVSFLENWLQERQHVIKSFGLFSQSCHEPLRLHLSGTKFLF